MKLHSEQKFIIGNIGHLSKQKGMEYFIKARPIVLKECPRVHLVIIGDGEEKEALGQLSKK